MAKAKKQKHPGGRPTKYKASYCQAIVEYFEREAEKVRVPFLSAWARNVAGVCEDTAIEWTKKHEEFSEAYKKAKDIQKEVLILGGLTGRFNPTFAIFTAKNLTDMRDKHEIDHTSGGERIEGFNYVKPDAPDAHTDV